MATNDGGPAFPVSNGQFTQHGMTLRAYAAIKLAVPDSGIEWLDDMIRASQRDRFAGMAMHGIIAIDGIGYKSEYCASMAYEMADAMLKARGE